MPTQLFFSNNIESLAETFARSIAEQHDWFDPCTVIVPNPYLKKWLQLKIARINGIAINFNFQYLNDGLWGVVKRYDPHSENRVILEPGDLQLMLYHLLNNLDRGNRRVKPLLEYLFNTDGSRRTDYEKKVWQLTSRLARYFLEYEFYREDMIKIWLEGKLLYHSDMEAAQQFLYYSLFRKNGYRDALNKNHVTLPQYWNSISQRINRTPCCKLHLFGKSQLSPFHIRMIYELGKHLDISIYQMNPCSEFWEDVTTPGEDRWQRIRSIPIQENGTGDFLADNADENSLLKQWGKTGRETIKLLSLLEEAGSGELSFISRWIAPESSRTETTCLNTMQSQILKRTTLTGLLNKLSQDASIQIASCPDIFREAETVYNSILYNLERDADLKMTDIAVMVPDMDRYGPVLESVFSGFPRKIAFSIIDSSAAADSLFGKALLSILEIASGLFSRKEVFELINNQCFLTTCSMTTDDASTWLSWADALNVFRGFNTEDAIDPGRNLYTWQQGLQRLRLGRIMRTTDLERHNGIFLDFKNIIPYADMETNDQYTIDTFNLTIELLYNRIKDLPVLKTSGLEWLNIIEKLIADFIAIPADRREEYHVLNALLASLKKLLVLDSLNFENRSGAFSFPFIKEFITENLTAIPSIRGSYLNSGINISALVPKRQIPFKIIYIMGMQEGVFPGVSDFSTLNLMNTKRRVGDVTRPDINRYLFLETLLGTREKLYITYVSKDLQKDQDFYPNSVIGQLITYLSNHVTAEAFKIVQVPASGISDAYLLAAFQTGYSDIISSRIDGKFQPVNFSEADRLVLLQTAAKNYTLEPAVISVITEKLNAKSARLTIPPEKMNDHEKIIPVSLRDLANYLINPVESTLRWHLNIYDEDDENRAQLEDEPFFSVYPNNYRFISDALNFYLRDGSKAGLQTFIDQNYHHAQLKSITPEGAFAEIDLADITSVIMERVYGHESLSEFVQSRKNNPFYQNIAFGSATLYATTLYATTLYAKPDRVFPSILCSIEKNNRTSTIELSGTFSFLWKSIVTGEFETLVITNSSKPSVTALLTPFLAYVISRSGYEKSLQQFIGPGSFTIHVSFRNGMAAYRYCLGEQECKEYVDRLLRDFLDESSFDLLPIQIIANNRHPVPSEMKIHPDDSERREYQRALARLINDDADTMFPSYRAMNIIGILGAEVPGDAYDKVRDRLGIIFQPFLKGEKQG